VFSETALTKSDFDHMSNLSIEDQRFNDRTIMEFRSREGAEEWANSLDKDIKTHQQGRLHIHSAHGADKSNVDAYLLFMPRS
jgi:hypothetical protein